MSWNKFITKTSVTSVSVYSNCVLFALMDTLLKATSRWSTFSVDHGPDSASHHTDFNGLNYNSCFNLSPPHTDSRDETLPSPVFFNLFSCEWGNKSLHCDHFSISPKYYYTCWPCPCQSHSASPGWIIHLSISSSLPEPAAQLLHPALSRHPSLTGWKDTNMSQVSLSIKSMSTEVLWMWKSGCECYHGSS